MAACFRASGTLRGSAAVSTLAHTRTQTKTASRSKSEHQLRIGAHNTVASVELRFELLKRSCWSRSQFAGKLPGPCLIIIDMLVNEHNAWGGGRHVRELARATTERASSLLPHTVGNSVGRRRWRRHKRGSSEGPNARSSYAARITKLRESRGWLGYQPAS